MSAAVLLRAACAALDSAAGLSLVQSHRELLQVGHLGWVGGGGFFACPSSAFAPLSFCPTVAL